MFQKDSQSLCIKMKRQSKNTRTTSTVPVTTQSYLVVNKNNHRSHVEQIQNAQYKEKYLKSQLAHSRPDSGTNIYNQHCILSLLSSPTISLMNQIWNDQFDLANPWVLNPNTKVASKSRLARMEIEQNPTAGPKQNFFESGLLQIQGHLDNKIVAGLQMRLDLEHLIEETEKRIFIRQQLLKLIKCHTTQPTPSS